MAKLAIIKAGGKQYLVKGDQEIVVGKIIAKDQKELELETLAVFDEEGTALELGAPVLSASVKAEILGDVKGEKVRVAKFKSKVRYRKVRGFRPQLTKLKIGVI